MSYGVWTSRGIVTEWQGYPMETREEAEACLEALRTFGDDGEVVRVGVARLGAAEDRTKEEAAADTATSDAEGKPLHPTKEKESCNSEWQP